jgi:microcin C transport system permease protein
MFILSKLVYLAIVLALGFFITRKVVPFLFVRIGRLLGFRMQLTPITAKRFTRFRRISRGYWSFMVLSTLFVTSLFLELIVNEKPLVIKFQDKVAYPALADWAEKVVFFANVSGISVANDFGQSGEGEVDYKLFEEWLANPALIDEPLATAKSGYERWQKRMARMKEPGPDASEREKDRYAKTKEFYERRKKTYEALQASKEAMGGEVQDAWVLPTLYPHSPDKTRIDEFEDSAPHSPSLARGIPLGTTDSGMDVLAQLLYGFRISLAFALLVAFVGYSIGVIVGGVQGYFGGWVDILSQRFVEIWGSIPFLFTIMILASLATPSFMMLAILLIVLRSWLGITYYVRGEFYREKAKDYVQAAIGAGVSDWKIITKHILPNSLVPVVTFAPFGIVAYISSLVSLDYLGFGLPPGTPSWGKLLQIGLENVKFHPYLVIVPVVALASTLFMVVMIGEALREAFDPKVFSRLR